MNKVETVDVLRDSYPTIDPRRILMQGGGSESDTSDDEPGVRRSAITGKKIKMRLENQTSEDHARAAGRKHLLQFMNSQF